MIITQAALVFVRWRMEWKWIHLFNLIIFENFEHIRQFITISGIWYFKILRTPTGVETETLHNI